MGDENKTANDIPVIGSISPDKVLSEGETRADIYVDGVLDADGIGAVFAVIRPPHGSTPGEPVTDLPTVILSSMGDGCYKGSYNDFTAPGSYHIAVFARDSKGTLSLPRQTTVTKEGGCLSVNNDLSIRFPCVEHNGGKYAFTFRYFRNPHGSGYCWWLDKATLGSGDDTGACLQTDSSLAIDVPCAVCNGTKYGFTLRFYDNPEDGSEWFWQMDMSTLEVR